MAGSPIQNLFVRTVLLAPYLGYDAPTSRPDSGGWASPDIPRFLGSDAAATLGIVCCESLPTIAFAVPPEFQRDPGVDLFLSPDAQFRQLVRIIATILPPRPSRVAMFAGAADELMFPDKYREARRSARARRG